MLREYKIKWIGGEIQDHVQIHDGANYTWADVQEVLHEYGPC